jgi:hypothetical protein
VLILETVKVVCFVTLLQVLILKGVIERGDARHKTPKPAARGTPHPGVFPKKRLDLLDSKGVDFFGSDKEAARIWGQRV